MSKRTIHSLVTLAFVTAACLAVLVMPAMAAEEFEKYAVESVSASLSTPQAGAHASPGISRWPCRRA
jgi:hypothetical protein